MLKTRGADILNWVQWDQIPAMFFPFPAIPKNILEKVYIEAEFEGGEWGVCVMSL